MQYTHSETQQLLQITSRAFLAERFPWERLYEIEDGRSALSEEDVASMAELGWLSLVASEEAGGGGIALIEAAIIVEELGYAGVPTPVAASNVAAYVLEAAGASEKLADLTSDRARYTISETSRRQGSSNGLTASGGTLSGTLLSVPFAQISNLVLAPVMVDGEPALAALPIEKATVEPVKLLDGMNFANLSFDAVTLDEADVLATGAEAEALHERYDALATAFASITLAGMMRRVQELTAEYITGRIQFGQPIAKFQAARHRAAELLMSTEMTRWAAYHALWRFQEDPGDTEEIWLAKHYASRQADPVYQHSHMLHGGVGVGTEYPLHLFTQGITALAVRNGSLNEMTDRAIAARGVA